MTISVSNFNRPTQLPKRYSNRDRESYPQAGSLFFMTLFCAYWNKSNIYDWLILGQLALFINCPQFETRSDKTTTKYSTRFLRDQVRQVPGCRNGKI